MHNELVEAFVALRDHERACFSTTAPLTAAVDWHRAFRDMESRWEVWIKRFRCGHDLFSHDRATPDSRPPEGWSDWVAADTRRRDRLESVTTDSEGACDE
jgi:hypothetical protein